jgi:hypothetical protein
VNSFADAVAVLGLDPDAIRGLLRRRRDCAFQARLRRSGWRALPDGRWRSPTGRDLEFAPAYELLRDLQKIHAARNEENP